MISALISAPSCFVMSRFERSSSCSLSAISRLSAMALAFGASILAASKILRIFVVLIKFQTKKSTSQYPRQFTIQLRNLGSVLGSFSPILSILGGLALSQAEVRSTSEELVPSAVGCVPRPTFLPSRRFALIRGQDLLNRFLDEPWVQTEKRPPVSSFDNRDSFVIP